MRIWTHNSLRWVYTSWFLFLNLCWTGRCWGIAFSIFSFRFWLKDTLGGVFFFPLKPAKLIIHERKNHHPRLRDVSIEGQQQITWGLEQLCPRMVFLDFIICRNGGEEKVQELLLPVLPPSHAQSPSARSQGMWLCSGQHSQQLKSWGMARSREILVFQLLQGDWIPSAVRVLQDLLLQ